MSVHVRLCGDVPLNIIAVIEAGYFESFL